MPDQERLLPTLESDANEKDERVVLEEEEEEEIEEVPSSQQPQLVQPLPNVRVRIEPIPNPLPNQPDTRVRTSSRIRRPTKFFEEGLVASDDEPKTYQELLQREDINEWLEATRKEIEALYENNTFEFVEPPRNQPVVTSKWVFKLKMKPVLKYIR